MKKRTFEPSLALMFELLQAETPQDIDQILHRECGPNAELVLLECAYLLVALDPDPRIDVAAAQWECHPLSPHLSDPFVCPPPDAASLALLTREDFVAALLLHSLDEPMANDLAVLLDPIKASDASTVALLPAYEQKYLVGALILGFGEDGLPDEGTLGYYQLLATQASVALRRLHVRSLFERMCEFHTREDATEHVATTELGQRYDLLMAVLDAISNPIVMTTPDRQIELANQRTGELLGLSPDESLGEWDPDTRLQKVLECIEDPEAFLATLSTLFANPALEGSGEVTIMGPGRRTVVWVSRPIYGRDGVLLGRLYSGHDVTEERQAQRKLREMISVLAHELRTPLTPVFSFPSMLEQDPDNMLSEQSLRYLHQIKHCVSQIRGVVEDILALARIEHSAMRLRPVPVAFAGMLREALAILHPQLEQRFQTISVDLPDDLPLLSADPDRLRQMLCTLIRCASVHAGHEAHIAIDALVTDSPSALWPGTPLPDGMSWETLRIITSNDSASPEGRESFCAGSAEEDTHWPSAGLGLLTAQAFAALHGGGAWVERDPGKGSIFLLGLPLAGVWFRTATRERSRPLILLALPHTSEYFDLQRHLQDAGYAVMTAESISGAMHIVQEYPPALILLAGDLPEEEQVSRDVLIDQAKQTNIVVLQISIKRVNDGSLWFSLGLHDALHERAAPPVFRPFTLIGLLSLLARALDHVATRILLVDSDERTVDEIWRTLEHHHHNVRVARTTEQAIAMAHSLLPNLIIVAVDQSDVDYHALSNDLRRSPHTSWIPVVAISSSALPKPLGAVKLLPRSVKASVLLAVVERELQMRPPNLPEDYDEGADDGEI